MQMRQWWTSLWGKKFATFPMTTSSFCLTSSTSCPEWTPTANQITCLCKVWQPSLGRVYFSKLLLLMPCSNALQTCAGTRCSWVHSDIKPEQTVKWHSKVLVCTLSFKERDSRISLKVSQQMRAQMFPSKLLVMVSPHARLCQIQM